MDITKTEEKVNLHLNGLRTAISDMNEMETGVKKLMSLLKVEILAYPSDKLFRLRDNRLRHGKQIIQAEYELTKPFEEMIEEVDVNKVSFEGKRYDSKIDAPFKVIYETSGYYEHNNKYENEDFGKAIFTTRSEITDILKPAFEKSKEDFIEKQKQEKDNRRIQLENELAVLKK